MYDLIVFDLDGTLLDTSLGIRNSVRYAEEQLHLSPIPDGMLKKFIGPPPKDMYKKIYGLSEKRALEAAEKHRKYGREKGFLEARPYPGIESLLDFLRSYKIGLAVATLKQQAVAEKVLRNAAMDHFFDVIIGMKEQETLTKAEIIRLCVLETGAQKVLMVGDTEYDYEGAKKAGVDFIGVTYGFGFKENGGYPFRVFENPMSLLEYWKKMLAEDEL